MVERTMHYNTPRYPANFGCQNQQSTPPISPRFQFQSNQGSTSSREPYSGTIIQEKKKNVLFTLSWKKRNCYDKLLYGIWFWDFLAQRKFFVKLVQDILQCFIINVSFISKNTMTSQFFDSQDSLRNRTLCSFQYCTFPETNT